MKYLIVIAALATYLTGCSPRPSGQGGEFDATLLRKETGGTGSGVSGSGPSTPWPTSKPEPGLGLPRVEDPGSGEEDLFLPKRRYETLHI